MLPIILFGLIILISLTLIFLAFRTGDLYADLLNSIKENSQKINQRARKLKSFQYDLEEHPKELKKGELEHVMEEIRKISKLWKDRRERLKMGLWERMSDKEEEETKEEKPEEKEKEDKGEDELLILKKREEQIKNLMKKTKIEYRKRKIDEVSFREIMRDYQKEMMEIEMRISELES